MPSWITHIATAKEVAKRINIKENKLGEFVFGNIMPDILEGHQISVKNTLSYYITHFAKKININGIELLIPDIELFKKEYEQLFNNPVVCGFFIHLLTDYFWNEYTYRTYFEVYNKEERIVKLKYKNGEKKILTWNEAVREKQGDFAFFTKSLQNRLNTNLLMDINKIWEECKSIKEFTLAREDIESTIQYLKSIEEKSIPNAEYRIFNQNELEHKLDDSISFIIEGLE